MADLLLLILAFGGAGLIYLLWDPEPYENWEPYKHKEWKERQKARERARQERKRK